MISFAFICSENDLVCLHNTLIIILLLFLRPNVFAVCCTFVYLNLVE